MPRRPARSGRPSATSALKPVLDVFEAIGFAFGQRLRGGANTESTGALGRNGARKRRSAKVAAAVTASPAVKRMAAAPKRRGRRRAASDASPQERVVTAKPPIIRRRARPADGNGVETAEISAGPVSAPASAGGDLLAPEAPTPGGGASSHGRGDRIWFRGGDGLQEGEVLRVSPDGRLVVAPIPAGDRLLLESSELVQPPTA